jgi:inositol oxygenase
MDTTKKSNLRIYDINSSQYKFYKELYKNQNLDSVLALKQKYSYFNNREMTIIEALNKMNDFVDPSDPDLPDVCNLVHAYQTAERIRKKYPEDKGLQVTGLIHDLGKILFMFGESDYNVVGDTFVVGAKIPKSVVCYSDDIQNDYDDKGIYEENCGIDKLHISFGHDEYLYQVLKFNRNKHTLGERYLNMIRYHSFYPWHTSGEYRQFMKDSDYEILKDVNILNSFDLYSKEDDIYEITDDIKNYYKDLLNVFFNLEKIKF